MNDKNMKILIINGPNINLLGRRESEHYGEFTYKDLTKYFDDIAKKFGVDITYLQSNLEGEIINFIQEAGNYNGLVINPAGYSHTSVAILDALKVLNIPIIEVHISNIYSREEFRQTTITARAANGVISGLGKEGYMHAVKYLLENSKKISG